MAGHRCFPAALSPSRWSPHVYPGGFLVHHLFVGVLIEIPAAFVLAFGTRNRGLTLVALVALGIGSGMILDEVTYLVMTKASDADYVFFHFALGSDHFCFTGRGTACWPSIGSVR